MLEKNLSGILYRANKIVAHCEKECDNTVVESCTNNLEILSSDSMTVSFYLIGIFGILPLLLQDCLPSGSTDFTASAALQSIFGSTL